MSPTAARLTRGPVGAHLVKMSVPMIAGIFAMMTFNVVDTWFVAQLGAVELAAISFTFPVAMVMASMAIGLGAGTSSIVARAIGRGDWPRVQRLATDALALTFVTGIVLAIAGVATLEPLFRLLGASEETLPLAAAYMRILYIGTPLLLVPMVGMTAIRATGDTRIPSLIMIGSSVVNLALDPLLIFGIGPFPRLELEGAALASVIARIGALIAALLVMHYQQGLLTRHIDSLRVLLSSWKEILHVGLPAAGTNAIIPMSMGVATALLATYGQNAVAGFGVATRVESMVLIIFYALSAVIGPFAGQNLSAGDKGRILEALRLCVGFCLAFGVVLALALAGGGRGIAELFTAEPEVVAIAAVYFLIVPISYGASGIVMIMNATFNGLGKPLPAVVVSVSRMVILFLPLAWLGSRLFGVAGIFTAYALANVVCGLGAYIWTRRAIASVKPG